MRVRGSRRVQVPLQIAGDSSQSTAATVFQRNSGPIPYSIPAAKLPSSRYLHHGELLTPNIVILSVDVDETGCWVSQIETILADFVLSSVGAHASPSSKSSRDPPRRVFPLCHRRLLEPHSKHSFQCFQCHGLL